MNSIWLVALLSITLSQVIVAYPLDGSDYTGIQRLEGYRLGQQGKVRSTQLPAGALLEMNQVSPQLERDTKRQIPLVDSAFSEQVRALLPARSYGIAVLDLSDRAHPVYAEHNAEQAFNPGSVGKTGSSDGYFSGPGQHLSGRYIGARKCVEKIL